MSTGKSNSSNASKQGDSDVRQALPPKPKPEWSVLVYIAGDNNLSSEALQDVQEMCDEGASENVHVGVELDTAGRKGVLRYEITDIDWSGRAHRKIIERQPETNSGSPITLRNFLVWGFGRADARKRLVIVWGHGMGREVAPDYYHGGALGIEELDDALEQAGIGAPNNNTFSGRSEEKIAVLGFDACLMSMIENVHHFSDRAKYMVASQELVPSTGWPYGAVLRAAKSSSQPGDLAKAIVNAYVDHYQAEERNNVTLSAINVAKTQSVIDALHELGLQLEKNIGKVRDAMREVRIYARSHFLVDYVDIVHMSELIDEIVGDAQVSKAAQGLIKATRDCVYKSSRDKMNAADHTNGLSVWFPAQPKLYYTHRRSYLAMRCNAMAKAGRGGGKGFGWARFLDAYHV